MKPYSEAISPLLKKVREMVMPHYGSVEKVEHKDNSGFNVVTELDRKVELFLAENLQKAYPGISFFGEEFGGNKESERFWIVDPIDATAHFVRGNPFCTTQLALIEEGKVTFSAIYDFVRDEMYLAERGKGATKNGQAISVSSRPLRKAYLGFEIKLNTQKGLDTFLKLNELSVLFKTVSAGYEYALVASGNIDGRICNDPFGFDYDYAPGSLLVEEAGGVVKNIGSDSYGFKNYNFVSANPKVYEDLRELGLV